MSEKNLQPNMKTTFHQPSNIIHYMHVMVAILNNQIEILF